MASYNKVLLMGNLTRDIELRHTNSNLAVANIGIAVNRRYKTAQGEEREEVTFVDCEAWGATAEVMAKYLVKGRPVFIEGRLKLDQWQDREGNKQSKLRVVVEGFQFIDSRGGGPNGGGDSRAEGRASAYGGASGEDRGGRPTPESQQSGQSHQAHHEPVAEEDIPF